MTTEHINYVLGGKSGHRRAGWSVTPTRREAGKVPQKIYRRALNIVQLSAQVRVKWWCKRPPVAW